MATLMRPDGHTRVARRFEIKQLCSLLEKLYCPLISTWKLLLSNVTAIKYHYRKTALAFAAGHSFSILCSVC